MTAGPDAGQDQAGPARLPPLAGLRAAAGFLLTSLPLAVLWFVALAAPIVLGASLAVLWVVALAVARAPLRWAGRPRGRAPGRGLAAILAPLMALSVRGAHLERRRIENYLGHPVPTPYRHEPRGSMLDRAYARAGDAAVWRELVYLLLLSPVGALEFAAVAAAFVCLVGAATLPAWLFVAFPEGAPLWREVRIDTLPEAVISAAAVLPVSALAAYLVISGASRAHSALGDALLGPSRNAQLARRVAVLTESRSRTVEAAIAERRRIERDLHDGAQQRLVSLAMGLGMAKEKMKEDPAAARELVEEAHGEAKLVLSEIRDLVRGIYPAILTDRGLGAALSALAARSRIPVALDLELEERLPEAIETTAYFVVAEALSNAAKHSSASRTRVAAWRERTPKDRLIVEVTDNGSGGATRAANGGLSGLAERLSALDGRLIVHSPEGAPTLVRAEIPAALAREPRLYP